MKNKTKLVILSLLIFIFSLGAVSASDINANDDVIAVDEINDQISVNDDDSIIESVNDDQLSSDSQSVIASGNDDSVLSVASSEDVLSVDDRIPTILTVNKTLTRVATDYNFAGEHGGKFSAYLTDINGNPLAGKKIQIAVNGPIYNVTTDSKGYASLDINLASANIYTYALSFSGDKDYSAAPIASTKLTITKKPTTIVASGKTFKKSAKNKKITVSFKTSNNPFDGKMYLSPNKVIVLKINGKKYSAKTNANNKVTFNLSLNKKGKYTGKLSFAGTQTYAASSKTIKITVK